MAKIRDILINIKDVVWWSPAINFTEKNKAEKASYIRAKLTCGRNSLRDSSDQADPSL